MTLAVVRSLREPRGPVTEEELADLEVDVLSEFVLARNAAGLVDSSIRSETLHLELVRKWFERPLWELEPRDADRYFGTVLRKVAQATRTARARALVTYFDFLETRHKGVHRWTNRRTGALPTEFRGEVRAWLVALHEGDARARPRAEATLHAYYSRLRPVLIGWAPTRSHLREVTRDDVSAVLKTMTGHRRTGTFVALRSLFRFAKRCRLIFVDPTRRLHSGRAPRRAVLPMTAEQVDIVT